MKPILTALSAMLLLAATADFASAWHKHRKKDACAPQDECGQGCGAPPCGPQMCGPQMYGQQMYGQQMYGQQMYGQQMPYAPPVMPQGYGWAPPPGLFGPPPFPPFQGVLPASNQQPNYGGCPLPQHPYARSPRDFFMYGDRDNNGTQP